MIVTPVRYHLARLGLRQHVSLGRPLPKGWDPSTGQKANLAYGK